MARAGKNLGKVYTLFPASSLVSKFVLRAVLGDKFEVGSTSLTKEDLKSLGGVRADSDLNTIMIQTKEDKVVINFGVHKKVNDPKLGGFISTKATFAVDLKTLDVYNSEY